MKKLSPARLKWHLLKAAKAHRDMGDPLSVEELASIAADYQRQAFEKYREFMRTRYNVELEDSIKEFLSEEA